MNLKMECDSVQCPICSKEFPQESIEAHASRCLFLNEALPDSQGCLKRPRSDSQSKMKSPIVTKKPKSKIKIAQRVQSSQSVFGSPLNQDKNHLEDVKETTEEKNESRSNSGASKKLPESTAPLAERMRPASLLEYVGQSHIIGHQSMLHQLLSKGEIPNIILWGPPGCGKTSLANVIATMCKNDPKKKIRYVKLSAAMSGVTDVKEATTIASNELKFGRRTVIFMDEIHRFNKAQQDIFLPHVEAGTITLIGATTENPSFSLNSALLSRCRVIVLEKLTLEDVVRILNKAVNSLSGIVHREGQKVYEAFNEIPKFIIDEKTIQFLAETCDGDARIALGGLELAVQSIVPEEENSGHDTPLISLEHVQESLKKTHMLYDRKGDQHYDMISALHKSVRASDENASLYWLTRMMAGGEDPVYIARRMVRMACEDIGLEDPKALGIAVHTMHACKMMGMPECDVLLAQCAVYLAKAPKSRLMEDALRAAQRLVAEQKGPQPVVPLHLRNAPTKLMKTLEYGKNYNMRHKDVSGLTYLPEGLETVDFFDGQNPVNYTD
ncbi:ATPase WRNIP1 isoform X1 [Fopius arisanus]|uniref:ATPase WRNIP1 isoform X1 n=2 Tax=Fopius arisanus TaxID=64838 RepID=A0A9R1TJM9_9HYME|nr:PREDICTED: ATPase WRNIP1-like isoform X1 [Fopius arisanus]